MVKKTKVKAKTRVKKNDWWSWIIIIGVLLAVVAGMAYRYEQNRMTPQCKAHYYENDAGDLKICSPGTFPPTSLQYKYKGSGKSDCTLVEDC